MINKKTLAIVALYTANCFAVVHGQENLERMFAETKHDGNTTIAMTEMVMHKEPENNYRATIIKIKKNKPLVDEFLEAFEKDRPNAQVNGTKLGKDNKKIYENFIFDKGDERVTYSYTWKSPSEAEIILTEGKKFLDDGKKENIASFWIRGSEDIIDAIPVETSKVRKIYTSENDKQVSDPQKTEIIIPDGVTIYIDAESFIYINGEKVTAKQAQEKGYNVKELPKQ